MSDIMLRNGDFVSTVFGDIAVLDDNDDIIQMAIHNILTRIKEHVFHPTLGNRLYDTRIKLIPSGLQMVEELCKVAILDNDNRVKTVKSIMATRSDKYDYMCDLSFVLENHDGQLLNSNITISLV